MKTLGERIFARDAKGRLLSRIGTLFLRTPGLVTRRGIHAMQRMMWLEDLNAVRAANGQPPLTADEENAELAESVDLIFTDDTVLIRPDPERMDLAMRADEELQKLVSKRVIRYLNTNSLKVRRALRERGENWRMARQPISPDDIARLVEESRVAVGGLGVYYYNRYTGTRLLTAAGLGEVLALPADRLREQLREIVTLLGRRNRSGHPEADLFPSSVPIEIRTALRDLAVDALDDAALRAAAEAVSRDWRVALSPELRDERTGNLEWRNEMCHAITRVPNETNAEEQELIAGIGGEFYRQIEWLPGARIDGGEVIFDTLYDAASRTQDPQLLALCDSRVKSFLFNLTRLFNAVEYVNVGRIAHSLARRPVEGNRRGNVYIVQYREVGAAEPQVLMIRLQKWGIAEHLDEGKDLLTATLEADEYSDYILDRRLMCRQLGMNLPPRLGFGRFTEKYRGPNQYNGTPVRTAYFVRAYVRGVASDKTPPARLRNPVFARRFAELMGAAAAVDLVVGRRSSVTGEPMFDTNYEVLQYGADGLPASLTVTDHAGSFVDYERDYLAYVSEYARPALRRRELVTDYRAFASAYVAAFRARLAETQTAYRSRRRAFDNLFADRPYDSNGSGAYRWSRALARLDACDPAAVAEALMRAVEC